MEEYVNKEKLERARVESLSTGKDIKELYLSYGGLIKVIEDSKHVPVSKTVEKKAKKK